jgi:hypothetical protein
MSKIDFKDYLKDCIKMVVECFDEDINDCEMAQQLKECSNYEQLADVMISWEFWEEDERYENLQYIK